MLNIITLSTLKCAFLSLMGWFEREDKSQIIINTWPENILMKI